MRKARVDISSSEHQFDGKAVDTIVPAPIRAGLNRDIFDINHARVFFDLGKKMQASYSPTHSANVAREHNPTWTDTFLTCSVPFLDEAS